MEFLRVGLVGLGMMGQHHARVLQSLEGIELVGAHDPLGDQHGVLRDIRTTSSLSDLLRLGLDYAVVAAPTAAHEAIALKLAEGQVHTLIEKPLAVDIESAQRIEQAFTSRELVSAVGHIERYNPALQSLRVRLEDGQLGEVFQIATRRQGPFPQRVADVGVVMDLASHDIDMTAWLGRSMFRSVAAQTSHRSGRKNEDLVAISGCLECGIVTNHLVNWLSPNKERSVVVTGENGAMVADTLSADLTFYANGSVPTEWETVATFRGVSEGDVVRYAMSKPEPLVTQHRAFRDAVLGISKDIVTTAEGLQTVKVASAVLRSAKTGATVLL